MKILKKMLIINWHYINKELIEFENINFLTGKNGAGKSTIIDALQLLILGDTRGTFFNKAANDRAGRSLEGYLRGEIGDDGDAGYKYLREGRFTSYIVCEFIDKTTRKNFCIGVVFDLYKDKEIEHHFFSFNGEIPENEFIGNDNIPLTFLDLKSFLMREYKGKNFEIYSSNIQYQDAVRGKLGGLNQKFFNLFKKAVTFTPIDDIEKFIVEYVCDVKSKIDITAMQDNIRQYNNLSKQVEIMKARENELDEIEGLYNRYMDMVAKERKDKFLILRAEKEISYKELEKLKDTVKKNKEIKDLNQKEIFDLEDEKDNLEKEIDDLKETRAKSDIEAKSKELQNKINELTQKIDNIDDRVDRNIASLRNHILKWNANIQKLEKVKFSVISDEIERLDETKDLLKYLEKINNNNFESIELNALNEIKQKIQELIQLGNQVFYEMRKQLENDFVAKRFLENDIRKLNKGANPYEEKLVTFKSKLEEELKKKYGKEIKISILADLLEIKDLKWQNAIEGYLNKQKNYFIIEPQYFEVASDIYRMMSNSDKDIHSYGIVDVEKISKEKFEIRENSLATEVTTSDEYARKYIDYLLGKVIKCESIKELRNNKVSITSDCMLYQGYVMRKINPDLYKYPSIGKNALIRQAQIKQEELTKLLERIDKTEQIKTIMNGLKDMSNFSEDDIINFNNNVEDSKKKKDLIAEREKYQKELNGMDMFWLNEISNKIKEMEELKREKERKISKKSNDCARLEEIIKINENEKIPAVLNEIEQKVTELNELYTKEWLEMNGEEIFGKECLKKTPQQIFNICSGTLKSTASKKEENKRLLEDKRIAYNTKYQLSFNIHDDVNKEFSDELKKVREIDLPEYIEKIEDSRKKAYEQFRIEFLDKLKSNIEEVKAQIKDLNIALSTHTFGSDSYSFKVSPKQEYKRFYNMITDNMLLGDWEIGKQQFNEKYAEEIKELFDKITTSDININLLSDEEYEKNIREYTDYRTYLNFDLIVKDKSGNEQRLSKTLSRKSGGETQTPFYISVLASFAQVYRIKNNENTVRLIVFDEAFSKMDSERIEQSIKLLRKIGFQAIFAAPPDKLQDIQELVDSTLLVLNPDAQSIIVKKYKNKEKW